MVSFSPAQISPLNRPASAPTTSPDMERGPVLVPKPLRGSLPAVHKSGYSSGYLLFKAALERPSPGSHVALGCGMDGAA